MFKKHKRGFSIAIFILYIIALCYFLFFAEMFGRTGGNREYHYNLVLFQEIKRFWKYRDILGYTAVMTNIVGNIVAFIPYGFFLPVLSEKMKHWFIIMLLSFTLSLVVEVIQLVFKVGCFDVDDLLLNTIGGVCGYFIHYFSRRKLG